VWEVRMKSKKKEEEEGEDGWIYWENERKRGRRLL
jgi:hypothetical protein